MQLLDSLQNQLPDTASKALLASLEDIASQVQIQPNFCIHHPDYKSMELPAETVERFQQLPLELQYKYRSLQLQSFLYGAYYNGSLHDALASDDADSGDLDLNQNLENNTFLGVDLAFYDQLHASNRGAGYFDPGWSVLRQGSDGSLVVSKNGLTLHVEPDRHLKPDVQPAVGDPVAIRLPRNRVQNGFYMAVGNAGVDNRGKPEQRSDIVRIYFNLSSEGAVAVMGDVTQQLNEIALPFTFKALYNPSTYGRYDSAVLYFEKNYYEMVRPVLQRVYTERRSQFHPQVPLFTKGLVPGLALAEEPDHKFAEKESFGMNRCLIVANALLEAWQQEDDSTEGRMRRILNHFSQLGLDIQHPYLNANSKDIYTPLDL